MIVLKLRKANYPPACVLASLPSLISPRNTLVNKETLVNHLPLPAMSSLLVTYGSDVTANSTPIKFCGFETLNRAYFTLATNLAIFFTKSWLFFLSFEHLVTLFVDKNNKFIPWKKFEFVPQIFVLRLSVLKFLKSF